MIYWLCLFIFRRPGVSWAAGRFKVRVALIELNLSWTELAVGGAELLMLLFIAAVGHFGHFVCLFSLVTGFCVVSCTPGKSQVTCHKIYILFKQVETPVSWAEQKQWWVYDCCFIQTYTYRECVLLRKCTFAIISQPFLEPVEHEGVVKIFRASHDLAHVSLVPLVLA